MASAVLAGGGGGGGAFASSSASTTHPIVFVRNLSYNITPEEIYEVFGQFGGIRQIRLGSDPETKGTAFVVYEALSSAKAAISKLNGFNVGGRYLVVGLHQPRLLAKRLGNMKKTSDVQNEAEKDEQE